MVWTSSLPSFIDINVVKHGLLVGICGYKHSLKGSSRDFVSVIAKAAHVTKTVMVLSK